MQIWLSENLDSQSEMEKQISDTSVPDSSFNNLVATSISARASTFN